MLEVFFIVNYEEYSKVVEKQEKSKELKKIRKEVECLTV